LKQFGQLADLSLVGTQVTAEGLAHLKGCPNLSRLHLSKTRIGDESIPALAACWKLAWLNLTGTRFTEAGATKLRDALPRCHIERETAADPKK
jgi:hypothetical protein